MPKKILIVDDDADMRGLLADVLGDAGYTVLEAADGLSGVRAAAAARPDAVLLDIFLTDVTGWEVLEVLRKRGASEKTPVLLMSGSVQAREKFLETRPAGCAFLRKPFEVNELFDVLADLLAPGRGGCCGCGTYETGRTDGTDPAAEFPGPDRKKKVLIVDDEPIVRGRLRRILQENGYHVVGEADDGDNLLRICQSLKPDLVTLDIVMKRTGGIQALKSLRRELDGVKVVMVTQVAAPSVVKECMAVGASNFILKPFDETHIVRVLENALRV